MATIETARGAHGQGGFTYLWLLLLVAFMGVGLTVAAEIDSTASRRDREKELLAIGRQFQTALGRYYETQAAGGLKEYPATLDDLMKDPRVPGVRRHLRKLFIDPITASPEWGLVKIGGRIVGVHSLSQQAPIKQAGFAPEHQGLRGKKKYSEWLFVYPPDLVLPVEGEAKHQGAANTQGPANVQGATPAPDTTVIPLKENQP
jgi:hypothetical protein